MTLNNPPHACESCGSQVEFPGLIYCARCQSAKSRRQAEVQAAASALPSVKLPVSFSIDGCLQDSDGTTILQVEPGPFPGTLKAIANLINGSARSVPAAPVSTAAATTASASEQFQKFDLTDYSKPVTYSNSADSAPSRTADGQQGASRAVLGMLDGLPTYDPERDMPGVMECRDKYHDGDYYKVEDVRAALARATLPAQRTTQVESPEQQEITLQLALQKLRREHPHLEHPDQRAVRKFTNAMEAKMAVSRSRGRGGWDRHAECTVEDLQTGLALLLPKGDPVDVANFCMMLWNRGEKAVAK